MGTKNLKKYGMHRTNEICEYLKSNDHRFNVLSWCALDDLSLNKYDIQSYKVMQGHFVKTNPKIGISPENILDAIDILNKDDLQRNTYRYYKY